MIDKAIENQINLLRYSAGEKKKVLAILDTLQKELRVKMLGDLTDFGKARVNKLLNESTAIIEAAYGEMAPGRIERKVNTGLESLSDKELLGMGRPADAYARNMVLEEAILRQQNGAYLLSTTGRAAPSLRDAVTKQLGYDVPSDELARAVRGLAALHPDSIKASLTLGLEEITISNQKSTDLLGLARHEAEATSQTFITIGLEASLPTEAVLRALVSDTLLFGAPLKDWWAKQADDLAFRYANSVRQGITQGETLQQIIIRVFGSKKLGTPGIGFPESVLRRNASTLVHDSIMTVANNAHMAVYRENEDISRGYYQLSTLDSITSRTCIAYSGAQWDLELKPMGGTTLPFNGGTPRHPNCRSKILPILKSYKELGADIKEPPTGTRASDLGEVPADLTFDGFLKRHDKNYQDDLLGPGRADMWRAGKLTLSDLVSGNGRELTLEQLRGKT